MLRDEVRGGIEASARRRLYAAAALRSFGVGWLGVVYALYLAELGLGAARIGLILTLGLASGAAATAWGGWGRASTKTKLISLALLGAAGLAWAAAAVSPWALALATLLGMVNSMGKDRGAAAALEQAVLADSLPGSDRTAGFVRYGLLLEGAAALGGLCAGALPYRAALLFLAVLSAAAAALYSGLPSGLVEPRPERVSERGRGVIYRLAGLSALDSLGGGFLTSALLAYWFFRRFGLDAAQLGAVFFAARLLNMASYPIAERLARRFGLVRTMVFTHAPASGLLVAAAFAPTAAWGIGLFLLRELLVQMDVPTRQSYTMAVVRPEERPFASSVAALTRNVGWALGPSLAGPAMAASLAAPLCFGAGIKLVYDLALYRAFKDVRPPEEAA